MFLSQAACLYVWVSLTPVGLYVCHAMSFESFELVVTHSDTRQLTFSTLSYYFQHLEVGAPAFSRHWTVRYPTRLVVVGLFQSIFSRWTTNLEPTSHITVEHCVAAFEKHLKTNTLYTGLPLAILLFSIHIYFILHCSAPLSIPLYVALWKFSDWLIEWWRKFLCGVHVHLLKVQINSYIRVIRSEWRSWQQEGKNAVDWMAAFVANFSDGRCAWNWPDDILLAVWAQCSMGNLYCLIAYVPPASICLFGLHPFVSRHMSISHLNGLRYQNLVCTIQLILWHSSRQIL